MCLLRSKTIIAFLAALAIGVAFLFGAAGGYYYYSHSGDHPHSIVRRQAMLSQAEQFPPGNIVFLGDSIVEFAYLDRLCGRPVLNAGLGGAMLRDVANYSDAVLDAARPRTVIVSAGVNDAQWNMPRNIDSWLATYSALLQDLERRQLHVYAMAVDPVEPEKPLGARYIDQSFIDKEDAGLAKLAAKFGAVYIPPRVSTWGLTVEGVHPTTRGYVGYKNRILALFDCSARP